MKPSHLKVIDADALATKLRERVEKERQYPELKWALQAVADIALSSSVTIELEALAHAKPVVDDNPEIGREMYAAGQVFEHDDGRMGMLIKTFHGAPYIFLESTREAFLLVDSHTAPTPLRLEQVVGKRDVGKWRPTEREFQTAPYDGDPHNPEMSQSRHH